MAKADYGQHGVDIGDSVPSTSRSESVNADEFSGPLFIVGIGRSGTKLLQALLNRNPRIGIPTAETGFIPQMVRRFGNPPRFEEDDRIFSEFYEALSQTSFFWYMEREGRILCRDHIDSVENRTSWSSIFESIFRFYAPPGRDHNFIWGDKTPGSSHLSHMNLLKTVFPTARFLHIIRDPRDVCLSGKRAWGRSLYRTATVWREQTDAARSTARQMGQDYSEVFYESLLRDPERVLRDVCDFLGCDFIPAMMTLERPSEQVGNARGQMSIVQDNMHKYRTQLSPSQVRRIEQIAGPTMRATGYEPEYDVNFKPLSPVASRILALHGMWGVLRYNVRERGLRGGLELFLRGLRPYLVAKSGKL